MSSISMGASLAAMAPPDLFDGIGDDTSIDTAPDTSAEAPAEESFDTGTSEDPAAEEPQAEPVAAPEPAVAKPDLPEGVVEGKDRNGKPGLFVEPNRWNNTFMPALNTVRDGAQIIGEPLTTQAIELRQQAFMGQERLYTDLISGDPSRAGNLVNHFFDEAQRALQNGETGTNPMQAFTSKFYEAVKQRDPDSYSDLMGAATADLVQQMYEHAAQSGDRNLWLSVGHMAKAVGLPYKKEAEMTQVAQSQDPIATLQAENQQYRSQLQTQATQQRVQAFNQWKATASQGVTGAVSTSVTDAIPAEVTKAWEPFGEQYKESVIKPLHSAVVDTLKNDAQFNERVRLLDQQAQNASAQRRNQVAEQIKQLYAQRAKLAVDAHKGKILTQAAQMLKQQSDATHQRRQAGQSLKAPRGPQSAAPRSMVPDSAVKPGGTYDAKAAQAAMQRLFQ